MLFSDAFGIVREDHEDWFDPLLNLDTRLFLDPFLLYDDEVDVFVGSHSDVVTFFNHVLALIARSGGDGTSNSWERAERLLRLPEVDELCLGYSSAGTRGSGSGRGMARQMAQGLLRAVQAGVTELKHFEEVQIFEEGIGADRISDATANIIRHRLVQYTENVCNRHGVELHEARTDRGVFDPTAGRWRNSTYHLPENPTNGKAILLVPQRYLRALPTINAGDFWDFCYDNHNEELRQRYGDDITRSVDKSQIVEVARAHPKWRREYVERSEAMGSSSYDLAQDRKGVYGPAVAAYRWAKQNSVTLAPESDEQLAAAVSTFLDEFRNNIENERGWILLWNDDGTPKNESTFQSVIMQTIATHARANNIEVSPEANIGRGPVDFKLAVGHRARVLIEAKLARNTRFWHGLERQLPKYLQAEGISQGFFVVCVQQEADLEKVSELQKRVAALNDKLPYRVRSLIVDARHGPPSASKL